MTTTRARDRSVRRVALEEAVRMVLPVRGLRITLGLAAFVLLAGGCSDQSRTIETGPQSSAAPPATAVPPSPSEPSPTQAAASSPPPQPSPAPSPASPPEPTAQAPAFTLTPTSGPDGTRIVAKETGCSGPDNGGAVQFVDPQGAAFWGERAGAGRPDGTWELETTFPLNSPPGRYTVKGSCGGTGGPVFSYPPVPFTVTE